MGSLEMRLRGHDWYYQYSDDHQAWIDGQKSLQELRELLAKMSCPFPLESLRKWAQGMTVEQWYPDPSNPKLWYRNNGLKGFQEASREALLDPGVGSAITEWIATHDK
jgi:hypothetical protein